MLEGRSGDPGLSGEITSLSWFGGVSESPWWVYITCVKLKAKSGTPHHFIWPKKTCKYDQELLTRTFQREISKRSDIKKWNNGGGEQLVYDKKSRFSKCMKRFSQQTVANFYQQINNFLS